MRREVHAGWTKLRTVPGPGWLLLGAVAVTVGVSAAAAGAVKCSSGGCAVDPVKVSLTGIDLGQAVVAILAVLLISGEYSSGMIRVTLAAMPRRVTMLAAKAAILTAVVLAAGTISVLGSLLIGRLILPGHGFTAAQGYPVLSLGDGPVLRAAAGSVLYLALIALLGLGAATIVRDPAPAIGVVLGLLYLFPDRRPGRQQPDVAAPPGPDRADDSGAHHPGHHQAERPAAQPVGGLGVLAAWAAGALLAGGLLLRLRDA